VYTGQCLCGTVTFEIDEIVGPFELCHCTRCRKSTGSAFAATVGAKASGFRIISGSDYIKTFELPIVEQPPAYTACFCSRCGSAVPLADPAADWLEIPAGLFDTELPLNPERHIYIEYKATWESIRDDLPTFTKDQIARHRRHDDR
jgi:hypothetical protein